MKMQEKIARLFEGKGFIFACYAAVTAFLLSPVLSVRFTPNIDLINHMTRHFVRRLIEQGDDFYSKVYAFQWLLVPDLGIDILAAAVMPFFDVYDSTRIAIGTVILLWTLSPAVLHRALWGRWSLWPLMASVVVYNATFTWGFMSYLLTAGFMMLVLAGWIGTDREDESNARKWRRIAAFSVLSFLVYCGHLFAFGVYGLLLGGYELSKLVKQKKFLLGNLARRALELAPLCLPAIIHFVLLMMRYPPAHGSATRLPAWTDRKEALLSPFVYGLETAADHSYNLLNSAGLLLLVAVFAVNGMRRSISMHKYMAIPLLLLLAAAALIPPKLLGVAVMHPRLPFVLVAVLIASTRIVEKKTALVACCAAALVLAHLTLIKDVRRNWAKHDGQVQEFIAKTDVIKRGDKVLIVNHQAPFAMIDHFHTGSYLVTAHQAFIPGLFTSTHIFHSIGEYMRLAPTIPASPPNPKLLQKALSNASDVDWEQPTFSYWKTWWKDYDYVVAYRREDDRQPLYPEYLAPVKSGSFFTVYKIKKTAGVPPQKKRK